MKKIFITVFIFAFFLFFEKKVFAQTPTPQATQANCSMWVASQECSDYNDKPHLFNVGVFTMSTAATVLVDTTAGREIPVTNSMGQVIRYSYTGGATGSMGLLAMQMIQSPGGAKTADYLADLGQQLNIVKPAYAQGVAFAGLSPLLYAWKISLNMAYLLYVVVFFVVGFMILMRKKIDPRTVISIEIALPKLIVTLIIITFSYAIISLMVDLTSLISIVIANLYIGGKDKLLMTDPSKNATSFINEIFTRNVFHLTRLIGSTHNLESKIGEAGGSFGSGLIADALGWLTSNGVKVVFALTVFFNLFKIFFALLTPYVKIVLSIIFAPFEILLTALPGSEKGVGEWLRGILANLAVFPVTMLLIIIAAVFGASSSNWMCPAGSANCFNWLPAFSRQADFKLIVLNLAPLGNWGNAVADLISLGILLTIPSAIELTHEAFKVKAKGGAVEGAIFKQMSKIPFLKSLAG